MPQKRKDLKIEGPNLWYLVGLITSDGCLLKDGRHINITSKEYEFLNIVKKQLGISNKIGIKYNNIKQKAYQFQIGNKNLYDFLLSVGITPNKSLTLGALQVPGNYFCDFLRGLIDGDGSIRRWTHPTNFREQWSLRIYSGSMNFLVWLDGKIKDYLKVQGRLHKSENEGTTYVLKYGKMAAKIIAQECYYQGCFGLQRKITLARNCMYSSSGWSKSKTIEEKGEWRNGILG